MTWCHVWPWDQVGCVQGACSQPGRRLGVNWTHAQKMRVPTQVWTCVCGSDLQIHSLLLLLPKPIKDLWGCLGPQGHLDTEDPPEQKSQCKEWALGGVRCHARPWRWQIRGQEAGREAPMEVQTGDGQMTEKGLQSIIYAIYPQGLSELGKCKSSLAQGGCWPTTSKALAPYPHPLPRARPCVTPCFLPKHSSLEPGQVETSVYINIYHSWQLSH